MKKILLLSIFVIIAVALYSFESLNKRDYPIDKWLKKCEDEAKLNRSGFKRCYNEAEKRWNEEIEKYYEIVMNDLDPEGRRTLQETQRLWEVFMNKEKELINNIFDPLDGNMNKRYKSWVVSMELIRKRALELKFYYRGLDLKVHIKNKYFTDRDSGTW